jgi:hypothetical protein
MTKIFFVPVLIVLAALVFGFGQAQGADYRKAIQKTVDTDGTTEMVINADDFNALFREEINGGNLTELIKSASVKVNDGSVEVRATVRKPIPGTIFVKAEITALNGRLYPKFLKIQYGFFRVPAELMNFFIGKITGQSYRNFQNTGVETPGLEWKSVDFKEGKATVRFKEI